MVALFLGARGPCVCCALGTPISSCSLWARCRSWVRRDHNPHSGTLNSALWACVWCLYIWLSISCGVSVHSGLLCETVCISIHAYLCRHAVFWNWCACTNWKWPMQKREGGGNGSIYIGSYTMGSEVTSKQACGWIVTRARESSCMSWQTYPSLAGCTLIFAPWHWAHSGATSVCESYYSFKGL